ncbi:MBL fold metallo-hydrolase [Dyadobacter aurulentus]|uniref:MBL fold metallo-hydrolase n=1 Tax=Dyadobacter sp. UC 10 TaxID=2605428 RepID=UPI0011F366D2|nr:MBL fold metallo-hydrolase [Dyadobacter sp. UC 10]KAA0992995.1 MBL fold metallo-hydrolase [Dyadobacter sp. UC 10]
MKTKLTLLLLLTVTICRAQLPAADALKTSKGPLNIQPLNHATMALTWNGRTIYADPYGGAKTFQGIAAPDLILITDIHGDHFDAATLGELDLGKAIIVAPPAVIEKMSDKMKEKAVPVANGQTISKLDISITAIPMYNLPESAESRHPKGRGNGYVLKFGDKSVYISGDTSGIPEMRALKNIDAAFVCMNLPYTMDIKEASSAVLDFKPKIVYPYHYRGQNGLSDTEAFKKIVNEGDKAIDVRLRDWYSIK